MRYIILCIAVFCTLNFIPENSFSKTTHTVKSGENLSIIASKYDIKVSELKNFNKLSSTNIKPGQKLSIPAKSYDQQTQTYTVKSGESLGGIAHKFGLSSRDLVKYNNLDSSAIKVGQRIKIPQDTNKTSETSTQTAKKTIKYDESNFVGPKLYRTYKVKSGDTLSQIAEAHGVKTKELRKKNSISGNNIRIGQKLTIPNNTPQNTIKPEKAPATSVVVKTEKVEKIEKVEKKLQTPQVKVATETKEKEVTTYIYVVKSGDTAGHIANKVGLRSKELLELNNLSKPNLKIGQKLILPNNEKAKLLTAKQKEDNTNKEIERPAFYTVKKGDTLSTIAEKHKVSTKNLKLANSLNSNKIVIGKKLTIPGKDFIPESVNKVKYKVRSGDSLLLIARKFNTNVKTLKALNNLSSSKINAGKYIYVPDNSYVEQSTPLNKSFIYKAQRGDSLGKISNKFGVSVKELKTINNLRSSKIAVGQQLKIPSNGLSSKTVNKVVRHKVRSGDSLSQIARRYNTTTKKLKKANNLRNSNIKIGQIIKVPVTEKSYVHSETRSKYTKRSKNRSSNELIKVAKKYLGAPYKFGGNSTRTGIDCSAYVKKVYSSFNVELPRTARDIYKKGKWVRKRDLQEGDLVFFRTYAQYPSHVGIYLGNDKFIHASSAKNKVTITNFKKNYYQKRYIGAKRIAYNGNFYKDYSNKL